MAIKKQLLLIDEDEVLRAELAEQLLRFDGFDVSVAANLSGGLNLAKAKHIDMVLLASTSQTTPLAAVDRLKGNNITAPVLILTDKNYKGAAHKEAFPDGVDMLQKPFHLNALLAQLRRTLLQYERSDMGVFAIGPYDFQPAFHRLRMRDKADSEQGRAEILLTDKETGILKYLYRAGGGAVSREELLHQVWGYHSEVTTHTLETHIYRLRQKIEPGISSVLLRTESGGYSLNLL